MIALALTLALTLTLTLTLILILTLNLTLTPHPRWVSTIYHILLILLCAFFCCNLALAVIAGEFEKQAEANDAEEAKEGQLLVIDI